MKILLALLFPILLLAQNEYVTRYEIDVYRINDGYTVPYMAYLDEGDTVKFVFFPDPSISESYQSPYTRFKWDTDTLKPNQFIWDADTAKYRGVVTYPIGDYELTVRAVIDTLDTLLFSDSVDAFYLRVERSDVPLSVFVSFFEPTLINSIVSLIWVTESELNNCGFNIYRNKLGGSQTKLNEDLIPGEFNSSNTNTYNLYDTTIEAGVTYKYTLESVSCDGVHNVEGEVVIHIPIISGIRLAQNYPNPFNGTTTIEYYIDEKSEVTLVIYDVRGREAVLKKEIMEAGSYKHMISSGNIASGTYIYFLKAHNLRTMAIEVLSRKMVVIK